MSEVNKEFSVLRMPVHLLDDYPGWLSSRLHRRVGTHVVTLNSEMTMLAEKNADLATAIRSAELIVPDGSGVVLYFWLRGQRIQRCPGIELAESMLRICGDGKVASAFFFGGKPGVAEAAAVEWQRRVPGLAIAGSQHGYLSPEQSQEFCQTLKQLQPRLILVGMGVPKQELWIAEHRHLCPDAIWIGVGGSFDIWAGLKSRAPLWLQKLQMEWLYRLYQEPWRWRRMLVLPQFAWRALISVGSDRRVGATRYRQRN